MKLEALRKSIENTLKSSGIEDAESESYSMIFEAYGLNSASYLFRKNDCADGDNERLSLLNDFVERRAKREPLQYIFGKWTFMDCEFYVGSGVFIPRDDTRVVVELALEYLSSVQNARLADLCAGSGAISAVLQKKTGAEVTAIEKSEKAFEYLKKNIAHNGVEVSAVLADVFEAAELFEDKSFDLIVSNPPYIESAEIDTLQKEVLFEPRLAFDGGEDGCDYYRRLIPVWSKKLKRGGALAFELGENQSRRVGKIMEQNGFVNIKTAEDIMQTERGIIGVLSRQ